MLRRARGEVNRRIVILTAAYEGRRLGMGTTPGAALRSDVTGGGAAAQHLRRDCRRGDVLEGEDRAGSL
jgi:hypothetical protein